MDGVLNFCKPLGLTSAKALYRVRKLTGVRKSGHAGTLDPAAEGVLLLCMGRATRLVERLMDLPKTYRATARLDVTSSSFDSDRPLAPVPVAAVPTLDQLRFALRQFEGEIQQVPPAVSAVKLGGRPAYRLAAEEALARLQPRPARIYWLFVHSYVWPELDFELACGRGTYVRALIRDIGRALHTGGCLTSLSRTAVGPFHVDAAASLADLQGADWAARVTPIERVLEWIANPAAPPPPAVDLVT